MADLSIEAKMCIGCWWNLLCTTELTFHRPHIIHPRTRAGLDELVEKGFLTVEQYNKAGAIVWKPTEKLRGKDRPKVTLKFMEENNFPITTE